MKNISKWMVSLAAFGLISLGAASVQAADASKPLDIAVIPKGTAHPFWKSVNAGAQKAAQECKVNAIWKGPDNESDRSQQIDMVNNFISRGVAAIVLAPLDDVALVRPVEEAIRRKIPVVIIDSDLKSDKYASFVATDNKEGGRMAARRLGEVLGGKGKAIMLRYNEGSASTRNREEGFLEEMKAKFPGIELVSTNQYAGVTKEAALQTAQNLLNKFGNDIQGAFASNESAAAGMLRALENSGKAGKIKFVGFDCSEQLLNGMKAGYIQGLIAQDPFNMGYQGVKTAVAAIKGEKVEKRVPTRVLTVTKENMEQPDIKSVISPETEAGKK